MNCSKCGDKINANKGHVCLTDKDRLVERVACLNARVAELEGLAVVWHKYPEKKPTKMKRYLVYGEQVVGDTEISVRYWGGDQFYEDEIGITHWAEVKNIPGGGPHNG